MTDPKPLSPAAQAVLDATFDHWPGGHNHPHKRVCFAAALRAAADQVVPLHICGTIATRAQTRLGMRRKLLAIAAELDPTEPDIN